MRRYRRTATAIAALLGLAAAAGCREGASQVPVQAEKVTPVEVYEVQPQAFTEYVTLPVVVNPYREASLSLTGGGRVVRLLADKGSRVRSGQVLLETETEVLRAALELARANLEFQRAEAARNEQLFAAASIPPSALDAARLALAQAQSQYDIALKQHEDATLKAPFGGTITQRWAELGAVLSPGAPAFRLIDAERVRVQAGIPERLIEDFDTGHRVSLVFDAIAGRTFTGIIDYLAPEASPGVRTFLCEIVVDNRDGAIRAGIMGNARIQRRTLEGALVIPLDALIETQVGRRVFVVEADSLAAERAITIGASGEDAVVASAGLQPGDPHPVPVHQLVLPPGDHAVAGRYQRPAYAEVAAQ